LIDKKFLYIKSLFLLQIFFIFYCCYFLIHSGKLPQPFHNLPFDVFMDFYNVNWWSIQPGIYEIWKSPYPPLTFLLAKLFIPTSCAHEITPIDLRACSITPTYYFLIPFLISSFLTMKLVCKNIKNVCAEKKIILFLVFLMSLPFLYTFERGNYIIFAYLFFCLYLLYPHKILSFVFLGLAVNFKPYLAVLYIPYILKKQYKYFFYCALFSTCIFFSSFLFLSDIYIYDFFFNLLNFNSSTIAPMQALNYQTTFIIFTAKLIEMNKFLIISHLINYWILGLVLLFFCYGIIRIEEFTREELSLLILLVLLPTSYNFGGYSFIFLLPFMAFYFRRNIVFFLSFLFLLCPIDFPIIRLKSVIPQESFFQLGYFSELNLDVTIGGIIRPMIVFILLFGFFQDRRGLKNE
jgi:hypothetical protein